MRIAIEVKLFAKHSKLVQYESLEGMGVGNQQYTAYLTNPPVDGKANNELINIVSDYFGVNKSQIKIIRGESSKHKIIDIII